jgi:hypothetical protein
LKAGREWMVHKASHNIRSNIPGRTWRAHLVGLDKFLNSLGGITLNFVRKIVDSG